MASPLRPFAFALGLCFIGCCSLGQPTAPAYRPEEQIVNYQRPQYGVAGGLPLYIPPTGPTGPTGPTSQTVQDLDDPDDESVVKRFNYFDLELLEGLSLRSPSENIFVSPASIKSTLGMILEGAKGKSASEIANVLRIPVEQQYVRDQLKQLLYDISNQNGYTKLYSANGVFVSDKLKVLGAYKKALQDYYKAEVTPLDYNNVPQSVSVVNQWVSTKTRGLIPTIVGPEHIKPDSSVLLTNAMFFKSIWKYAFDPSLTTPKCFHLPSGNCMTTNMMQNTAEVRYKMVGEINAHAVEIPYTDDYAMLILVPQVRHSITALLRDLQHVTFNAIVDKLVKTEVTYEIPRFDIQYNVPLRSVLQKMDIKDIFTDNANLSGIAQGDRVRVDDIVHKALVEVNERGTIAAAATSAVVIPLMGSSSPHVVANHPFVFFIYKQSNRNIVFEGVVNHPSEAAPAPAAPVSRIHAPRQRANFVGGQQRTYRFV